MNQEQIQQASCDEALVPSDDKIKINSTNIRIDLTVTQKEETYQVILDIIKNSACYNAFLVTTDVPEIYMQQFWNTILGISPRVPNEDFIIPPSEESIITFLYELGYKGEINKLGKLQVMTDCGIHMDILWGMFHKKNVDFAELIWKDFQYQIDYMQSKLRRREIMPYLKFTKIIINYFLSQHKSLTKKKPSYINTIKDDGVLNRLKFVRTGKDFQEYGQAITDTMLTDDIKNSEAYQAFIGYSTGLIPPKKSRGKGSQGKKSAVTQKNKSSISAKDNIIHELDVAFELGKSSRRIEAEIADEVRRVHETHERLVTGKPASEDESDESDHEPANRPTRRRRPYGVAFRYTSNMSKKKSLDRTQKLKSIQVMSEEDQ
ncbi:hypothetical protein Tco_1288135 [Tanacetum coccineum]